MIRQRKNINSVFPNASKCCGDGNEILLPYEFGVSRNFNCRKENHQTYTEYLILQDVCVDESQRLERYKSQNSNQPRHHEPRILLKASKQKGRAKLAKFMLLLRQTKGHGRRCWEEKDEPSASVKVMRSRRLLVLVLHFPLDFTRRVLSSDASSHFHG